MMSADPALVRSCRSVRQHICQANLRRCHTETRSRKGLFCVCLVSSCEFSSFVLEETYASVYEQPARSQPADRVRT